MRPPSLILPGHKAVGGDGSPEAEGLDLICSGVPGWPCHTADQLPHGRHTHAHYRFAVGVRACACAYVLGAVQAPGSSVRGVPAPDNVDGGAVYWRLLVADVCVCILRPHRYLHACACILCWNTVTGDGDVAGTEGVSFCSCVSRALPHSRCKFPVRPY